MMLDQPHDPHVDPADSMPGAGPVGRARVFLIADVRGYTRYTEQHGDAAAARLAMRFADLVREGLADTDGQLLGLRGDEALVAFTSARQALRTALDLQTRFTHEMTADPTLPLRVGMGLDAGEAVPVADGYRGMALNVAARLCALAGPGQVLLTPAAAERARGLGLAYVERGALALKGLAGPMRVLQALPTGFGVLVTAAADVAQAEQVWADLTARGVACWAERPLPGSDVDLSLHAAIRSAGVVLLLASPHARLSRHVKAALRLAALYERAVIPLWVAGHDAAACLPATVSRADMIDAREGGYADGLAEAAARLERVRREQVHLVDLTPPAPALDVARNPYKGLRAFGQDDAGDFFGRDAVVEELLAALRDALTPGGARLLAVTGPSGAGKSSVVRAGLAPRLKDGALPGSAAWLYLGPVLPGTHPLDALATTLAAHERQEMAAVRAALDDDSALGLHQWAQRHAPFPQGRVLLVIDQCEEVFARGVDNAERRRFLDLLVAAATEPGGPLAVVLTVRADFYHRFLDAPELWTLLEPRTRYIPPMAPTDLREAIVGPARLPDVGLRFEEGLVGDLLAEVEGRAGALPLLQFALDRLYEWRDGTLLTGAAYAAMGGVRGALARRAEATYAGLPGAERQALARALFLRLIELGESPAETVRRRAPRAELEVADPRGAARMEDVVAAFVGARLLTVAVAEADGAPSIEVSHEALIWEWERLSTWLREARDDVRLQGRISADVAAWARRGRPVDTLYRRTALAEALAWAGRNTPSAQEVAFLDAAVAEERRQEAADQERQVRELTLARSAARQLRTLVAGLAAFLLVAAGLAALALGNADQARNDRQQAVTARVLGLSRQLAAQAVTRINGQYDLALLLALEARRTNNTVEARDALLRTLQATPSGLSAFLRGHTLAVNALALSPNGTILASGGVDGTIHFWDLAHRRPLGAPLTNGSGMIGKIVFSPDGATVAGAISDGAIRLWDVRSRRAVGTPLQPGPYAALISIAFSPDGRMLAVGSTDNTIRLFDAVIRRGILRPIALIQAHRYSPNAIGTPGIDSLAWSPSGQALASGSIDGVIELWDTRHPGRHLGAPTLTGLLRGHTGTVFSLAFSPDGATLTSADDDHMVRVWDVVRQRPLGPPLRGHTDWVEAVAFNNRGSVLASGSLDGTIRLWDVRDRRPLGPPLVSRTGEVFGVVFSPNGATLAAGTSDGTIALWDVGHPGPPAAIRSPHLGYLSTMSVSPDSKTVAVAGFYLNNTLSGPLQVWDVDHRTLRRSIVLGRGANVLAFSPDKRLLAVAISGPSGRLELRDASTMRLLKTEVSTQPWLSAMAFSPDGSLIATGADAGTIQLWRVVGGAHVGMKPLGVPLATTNTPGVGGIGGVAFSPDGRVLASSDGTGALQLWDVAKRRALDAPLARPLGGMNGIAFSPDGRTMASADNDSTVRLWPVARNRQGSVSLVGHTDGVDVVAFSPDGTTLASAGFDRTVRLWDVASGQQLGAPFGGLTGVVKNLAFSPDGRTLIAASSDGVVRFWDVDLRTWAVRACRIANRNLTRQEWRQYLGNEPYHTTCPGLPAGS